MLMLTNSDGSVSSRVGALIDWQQLFEGESSQKTDSKRQETTSGNPLADLARFMTCSCDADIRRACETRAVDSYYERLRLNYFEHRGSKPTFGRETVKPVQHQADSCLIAGS